MENKRIYIIWNAWSGKSYLAKIFSEKFKLNHIELDDIFWEQKYSKKRSLNNKKELLESLINKNKSRIIEWIFTDFVDEAIKKADIVIWLDMNINLLTRRAIKRDIVKIIIWKNKMKPFLELIKFIRQYKNKYKWYYYRILHLLNKYKINYVLIKNKKEFNNYVDNI